MAIDKSQFEGESSVLQFYREVLTWDYLRILDESKDQKRSKGLSMVKNTYKDVDDYLSTFEPLLFEEVKAQIIQGQSDEEKAGEFAAAIIKCTETDGFHLITVIHDTAQLVSQNDLILISKTKFGEGKKLPTMYAFALVENCRSTGEQEQVELRMHLKGNEIESRPRLVCSLISEVNRSSQAVPIYILKICSLSTIAREYVALRSISSLPFKDLILTAKESNNSSEDRKWELPRTLMESLESNHNKSQMDSIRVGLSRKRFVLIQGPPGTGKTQTILGLLSAVLHATPARVSSKGKTLGIKRGPELSFQEKYKQWHKASPWLSGINPRDAIMPVDGDDGFFPTTGNDLKPEVVSASRKHRVRVLVCAPSNSALDEIVLRLLNTGIRDENDRVYNPKIVRIGLKPHHSVNSVSMDYLMEQKRAGMDFKGDKNKQGGGGSERDSLRASILDEAAIVFSTLSFSGSPLFSKLNRGFDVVIIDEAAQAVEAATLIPLANGCKQVFLVGDPVQLPATVISPVASRFKYGKSLFTRLQEAGYEVVMLKTQYRMHPEIRSFPSVQFYKGELEDGPDVEDQTKRAWHDYGCFGPFCFFDIHEGKESQPTGNTGSYVNEDEVDFVLALYHKLVSRYPELKDSSRLAIISPYQQQVKLFRERFRSSFGVDSAKLVDINTVDGFQGREKDVAIFSCVRANEAKKIGFVSDSQRMNVGLTRARSSILVVGSVSTLEEDKHWKPLIASAKTRGFLYKVSKPYKNFFSDENLKTMSTVEEEPIDDAMGGDETIYGNAEDAEQVPGDDDRGGDGDDGGGMDED